MKTRTLISFDWAMKRLLRNKANFGILNGFLSELLKEKIEVQHILESEGNQEDSADKYNKLDLLCTNERSELIAIEVQYYEESDFFHRILYGASKLITEFLSRGEPYAQVKKVYSINILYFDLGVGKDYIYVGKTGFYGLNDNSQLQLSENQKLKFGKSKPDEIFPEYYLLKINNFDDVARNTLDQWIYFLKNTKLPEGYTAMGLRLVESQLKYDNMDTVARKEYDKHLKDLHISRDMLETAEAKGEAKGKAKGKIEGKIEGKVEVILNSLANNLPIDLIANITNLTEEEVELIIKKHKASS